MTAQIPTIKLNNGNSMPVIALGTYKSTGDEVYRAVKDAIDIGYRHFDTAYAYENEAEVGRAISAKIAEGVIKREDVFIVTKLAGIHHEVEQVEKACRRSLQNLGLGYIDLYLLHFPAGMPYLGEDVLLPRDETGKLIFNDVDYLDTYKEMEKCVTLGLARSIGLSNFNSEQTKRVLDAASIKPVNNQVECSPTINQKKLIKFCKDHDIVLSAYCPLGRPNMEQRTPDFIFDARVEAIGKKYNKTTPQVALRYLIDIGTVPIPKSVTKSRIQQNFEVFDFKLTADEMKTLDSFNTGKRIVGAVNCADNKYFPFGIEY